VIEFWVTGDSRNASTLLDLLLTIVQRPRLSETMYVRRAVAPWSASRVSGMMSP
jgi:hypothetical protein